MEAEVEERISVAEKPPRNRLSGQVILAVLLVAFPLLALLVVEQGRVIGAQRVLIQQLSSDSQQLNAIRMHELQSRKQAAPPAKTPQAESQPQPSIKPEPHAAPRHKNRKRHESQQASPLPPQEYPATRPTPVRKSA
jgi:hypothetical protein